MSGLTSYIIRRLIMVVPMLIGISLLLFILMNMAPGGPEYVIIGDLGRYAPDLVESIRKEFGLDKPILVRYWIWLSNAVRGNFGVSTTAVGGVRVMQLVAERLMPTMQLTGMGLVVSVVAGIPLGVFSAVRRYTLADKIVTFAAFTGICFPTFWLGVMLIVVFSLVLGWLPMSGMGPPGVDTDFLQRLPYLVLPTLTTATVSIGRYMRFARSAILEVMGEDYIRTARAKGLTERVVLYKHALRNAMIPLVTMIGMFLRVLVGGSVLVETVFAWPGIGRLAITAISRRDYATVMAVQMVIAVATLLATIIVDFLYAVVDPRITYG
ncbi:MAG: ABC transporter permease [Bacillota bacterium]|nr:ABC transporter permease [Bacillota bacterium]